MVCSQVPQWGTRKLTNLSRASYHKLVEKLDPDEQKHEAEYYPDEGEVRDMEEGYAQESKLLDASDWPGISDCAEEDY